MASDISFRSLVTSQNIGSAAGRERVDSSRSPQAAGLAPSLALGRAAGRHSRAPQSLRTDDLSEWLDVFEAPL